MAQSDDDEDDFAVVYSRLIGVFRSQISFTIVFPLAIQLLKDIPPDTLDVYASLSQWSCYKTDENVTANWIEKGNDLLREATEEQYRVRQAETHTETMRREKTVLRQELANVALKKYTGKPDQVRQPVHDLRKQMDIIKEEVIEENELRRKEMEEKRLKATLEEKKRLLKAQKAYSTEKVYNRVDYGLNYWSIMIGGTAIAGAFVAIMKGYHYI
jgi:hypothetical protein